MSFSEAISYGFKNYAVFSGRVVRSAYWYFYLFTVIVSVVINTLGGVTGSSAFQILSILWALAVILPTLGLLIRRLHDANHAGWWIFIALVPIVGIIVLIVFLATAGTQGDNRYGPPVVAVA
jgi:uncharacterized membrane protein YhaH (DUF805 family)